MRQLNKKTDNVKKPYFYILLGLITVVLAFAQIFSANRLTTSGKILQKLDVQITDLESQNRKLEEDIAMLGNVDRLKLEAQKMGFTTDFKISSIYPEKPLALKN